MAERGKGDAALDGPVKEALDAAGEFLAVLVFQMRDAGQDDAADEVERDVLNPVQRALGVHESSSRGRIPFSPTEAKP